jgi:hypothetical protein
MKSKAPIRSSTNAVGDFGELLAATHLSRPVRGYYRRPLFRPSHLGQKYPVVDFIVDALDPEENSLGFFFVQVKAASQARPNSRTLRLELELLKYNKLASIPVPTFLIGVDTQTERAFLIAASRTLQKAFSSITKRHDLLDESVRVGLYKEVIEYWRRNRSRLVKLRTKFANDR